MTNELHEYYTGEYIKGLGIPTIILIGIENENEYKCQTFVIIENPQTNNFDTSFSNVITMKKEYSKENSNLHQFMLDFSLEKTKNDLYYKALELNNYQSITDFRISKNSETSTLMFIKSKSRKMLNYLFENTFSNKLRNIIVFYKELNFEIRKL